MYVFVLTNIRNTFNKKMYFRKYRKYSRSLYALAYLSMAHMHERAIYESYYYDLPTVCERIKKNNVYFLMCVYYYCVHTSYSRLALHIKRPTIPHTIRRINTIIENTCCAALLENKQRLGSARRARRRREPFRGLIPMPVIHIIIYDGIYTKNAFLFSHSFYSERTHKLNIFVYI